MRGTLLQGRDPLQTNQSPCIEEPRSQVAPYPQLTIQPLLQLGCHQKLEYCSLLLSICGLFCLFVMEQQLIETHRPCSFQVINKILTFLNLSALIYKLLIYYLIHLLSFLFSVLLPSPLPIPHPKSLKDMDLCVLCLL